MSSEAAPLPSSSAGTRVSLDENTIDEPVLKTIGRDLATIARNLRTVLVPINWEFSAQEQALRNWDLWGPLVSDHMQHARSCSTHACKACIRRSQRRMSYEHACCFAGENRKFVAGRVMLIDPCVYVPMTAAPLLANTLCRSSCCFWQAHCRGANRRPPQFLRCVTAMRLLTHAGHACCPRPGYARFVHHGMCSQHALVAYACTAWQRPGISKHFLIQSNRIRRSISAAQWLHPPVWHPPTCTYVPDAQLVFAECGLGAVVLTWNVVLLGGDIVFFQVWMAWICNACFALSAEGFAHIVACCRGVLQTSLCCKLGTLGTFLSLTHTNTSLCQLLLQALCLLGYCLFPICISAVLCVWFEQHWVRILALLLGIGWASWATIPFIGSAVAANRKALAVYPVVLMYVSIGWLALVKA